MHINERVNEVLIRRIHAFLIIILRGQRDAWDNKIY